MSNEAFVEFLKRDRLPRKIPGRTSSTVAVTPIVNRVSITTPPKQSIQDIAETITDPSACIIEIRNRLPSKLTHPKFYCCYGQPFCSPKDIAMGSSGTFAFTHTSPLVSGIFSYRIREKFLWVCYSTYEDRNFFSLAITPTDGTIGVEAFVSMARNQSWRHKPEVQFGWAKNGTLSIQSEGILVSGKMSTDVKSILEIEIASSLFSENPK